MLVKEISEQHIQDIGHAFGYYDYGEERAWPAGSVTRKRL